MTTWYSRSRRVSNSRDDNASLSTHVPNCWRCSSVSLLGAPLRGRSGKLAKPDFSHLRRRTRTASRHSLCCSATDCTLYPAASNKIVSARSRSRQSAPFLMISIRHSRSLSSNSIGATRATALSSVHIPECREFTANQLVAKCLSCFSINYIWHAPCLRLMLRYSAPPALQGRYATQEQRA